jgi:predicted MPP superfamily phosphohydrolase
MYLKPWLEGLETPIIELRSSRVDNDITLMVMSDLHLHSGLGGRRLERLCRIIAALRETHRPDIALLAGDFIDHGSGIGMLEAPLDALNGGLEKKPRAFAVLGNHDLHRYALWHLLAFPFLKTLKRKPEDSDALRSLFERKGVSLLEDRGEEIRIGETLVSIFGFAPRTPRAAHISADSKAFRIVLSHYPEYSFDSVGEDLFVAGHTHGGYARIGTRRIVKKSSRGLDSGLYGRDGRFIYVSKGVGSSREVPVRFGIAPDISFIRIAPLVGADRSEKPGCIR